jgi:RNA-directed DNA polymerase
MSSGFSFYPFSSPYSRDHQFREKIRAHDRKLGYAGYPLRVAQIAYRENLYECCRKMRQKGDKAPGVDGVRLHDLSPSEVGGCVGELSKRILDESYFPMPTRPVSIPKPGLSETRPLQLPSLGDKIVGTAIEDAFAEFWCERFLECSYGFRRRRKPQMMLAALEAQMHKQDRWILAIDDVRKAFDYVPIDAVIDAHAKHLAELQQDNFSDEEKGRTLGLIDTILRGHDPKKTRGICQGAPYSPTALNVLLHETLDVPIMARVDNKPLWFRYADNVVYLSKSVSEGRRMLAEVSRLLDPLGMFLKGNGAEPIDLSRGGKAHLLGFDLQREGEGIRYRIGKSAWDSLRQHLSDAHAKDDPSWTARAVVNGWIDAVGPAFESGDNVSQVLSIAKEYGFREISGPQLHRRWRASHRRWKDRLRRARCR